MNDELRIVGQCHCNAVTVSVPGKPEYLNDCNCSLCARSGAVWGYYDRREVRVEGATRTYARKDLVAPMIHLHFCDTCGTATHWSSIEPEKMAPEIAHRMGVNMRLVDEGLLSGVELRYPDGRNWTDDGRPSPRRPPVVMGKTGGF